MVGISRKKYLKKISDINNIIENNHITNYKRFQEVAKLVQKHEKNINNKLLFQEALLFHQQRYNFNTTISMIKIFSMFIHGQYKKFTAKNECAFLKDFIYVFIKRST